jgi:formate dehydrogenase subunit gamma
MKKIEKAKTPYNTGDADQSLKILRFRKSGRIVHWAMAIPFLVCFITALILVFYYNPDPLRPYRVLFSWTHRISGVSLIVFPLIAIILCKGDYRIYFYNIKQAWVWTVSDFKWLARAGLSVVSKNVSLPEQGKFNAGEKINFMVLISTYPLYILTGTLIWLTQGAWMSWLIHFFMAAIAAPLITGHLYIAVINPESRKGLQGIIKGYVNRKWAKHHYSLWYRDNFEISKDNSCPVCNAPINKSAIGSD